MRLAIKKQEPSTLLSNSSSCIVGSPDYEHRVALRLHATHKVLLLIGYAMTRGQSLAAAKQPLGVAAAARTAHLSRCYLSCVSVTQPCTGHCVLMIIKVDYVTPG